MKITSITRLISDHSYGNLSGHAELSEGEDVIKASVELDTQIRKALKTIADKREEIIKAASEMQNAKDYLENVLEKVKDDIKDLPF